ncbi:MAG TPA: hypothetical protein VF412_15455 [Bdellovibrio sp.]|uniref:hypothetical protein n=1 Tax=Bdellovibrio sp. TaxID=28201 RepID=UPI002F1B1E13
MRKRTLALLAMIIALCASRLFMARAGSHREPAMDRISTKAIPQESSKHLQAIKVQIEKPKSIPESGDEEVTLVGKISVHQKIEGDITYNWVLPEGVENVEGEISDGITGIEPGKDVEVKIVVTGFNKEKQSLIALQASVPYGNSRLGNATIISSRPEDTWESVAPQMQKAAEEHAGSKAYRPHSE